MSYLVALFAVAHQASSLPVLPNPDKVVVTVNGHGIKAKEVEAYLWAWDAPKVGQTLAVFEAVRQEAAKHSIVLSDAVVKAQVDLQIQQMLARAPKGMTAAQLLKQSGVSRSQIEFQMRAQMMVKQLAATTFSPANYYRVATIVVRPKSESAADVQASITAASVAYTRLEKGDPWGTVFLDTATDAQTVPNQGELGWLDIVQFPATTKQELLTLKVGEYTKPVTTPNGVQIFKLEARGKDAKPEELTGLKNQYEANAEREVLTRLQATAKISMQF